MIRGTRMLLRLRMLLVRDAGKTTTFKYSGVVWSDVPIKSATLPLPAPDVMCSMS